MTKISGTPAKFIQLCSIGLAAVGLAATGAHAAPMLSLGQPGAAEERERVLVAAPLVNRGAV
jgi:hypothetical protein